MNNAVVKALDRAVKLAGGQTALANKVNEIVKGTGVKPITQRHVWNWLHRDRKVPAEYAIPIEKVVDRKIYCHQLCPTVFEKIRFSRPALAEATQ